MFKIIPLMGCAFALASCCGPKCQLERLETVSANDPHYGDYTTRNVRESIRDAEVLKEYQIRPYVDPRNPNVRLPGGSMHVLTRPSRYNTEPNVRRGIVVEPQYAPVNEPRGRSTKLNGEIAQLKRQVTDLNRNLSKKGSLSNTQLQTMRLEMRQLNNRLLSLEGLEGLDDPLPVDE